MPLTIRPLNSGYIPTKPLEYWYHFSCKKYVERRGITNDSGQPPDFTFLIEGGDKLILVDTGMSWTEHADKYRHGPSLQRPGIDDIESRLAQVGRKPSDAGIVLFTHLHWDHVFYLDFIRGEGLSALVLNTATEPEPSENCDVSREEIAEAYGAPWKDLEPGTKGEKIDFMKNAVGAHVERLCREGKINGIMSVGGLQNTVMATFAMQRLPIGFPKVTATTAASGTRKFELVVGDKDIMAMPSICDFAGMNIVARQVIANACAACVGMVKGAGRALKKGERPVAALALMGVTNNGAMAAVGELERLGLEAIGFHATGVGAAAMESMAEEGLVGGFSYGEAAGARLVKSVAGKAPLVASLGGLDFVDFSTSELPPRMDERKYMLHNAATAHIKILTDEAKEIGEIVAERLSKAAYPVKLLVPQGGMRHNTMEGEELYSPETGAALARAIAGNVGGNVEAVNVPYNLDTREFGVEAARRIVEEMRAAGKLPQDFPRGEWLGHTAGEGRL